MTAVCKGKGGRSKWGGGGNREGKGERGRPNLYDCSGTLEDDGGGGGSQHVEYCAHVVAFFLRRLLAHLPDQLERDDLYDVAQGVQLRDVGQDKSDSARGSALDEHVEGVAARAVVSFNLSARITHAFNTPHPTQQVHLELPLHYLGRVDAERLRHTVGIVQGEHGIASHIAVAVVEVLLDRLHQRLQQLKLLQLGHEAQRAAAHKLVGVHEVLAQEVAHEDHLFA
jgi:hypothetical protein